MATSSLIVFFVCVLHLNVAKKANVVFTLHHRDIFSLFTEGEIWGIQSKNRTEDTVSVEVVIDETKLMDITTLHKDMIMGVDVIYPDAEQVIRKERERINSTSRWTDDMQPDIFFLEYRDWIEYEVFIAALLLRFPNLASMEILGETIQGRNIPVVKLSTGAENKPGFYMQGCLHAREWLACAATTKILNSLAEGYGEDETITNILNEMNIYIVPVVNIDGYIYSWQVNRNWRKNRRNNNDGTFGVDLNRNYDGPTGTWCTSGASTNPGSDTYCGPFAYSEPETVGGTNFILNANNNIKSVFDMHTSGLYIMWPWAYTTAQLPPADYAFYDDLGARMSDAVFAVHGVRYQSIQTATGLYPASGSSMDFAWTHGEILGFGFEGRGPGFNPSPTNIIPAGEEQLAAVITVAQEILDQERKKK